MIALMNQQYAPTTILHIQDNCNLNQQIMILQTNNSNIKYTQSLLAISTDFFQSTMILYDLTRNYLGERYKFNSFL